MRIINEIDIARPILPTSIFVLLESYKYIVTIIPRSYPKDTKWVNINLLNAT